MHLIAGARGAMAGLMAEVVQDHVRSHLVDVEKHPGVLNTEAAEQLLDVVRTYLKWAGQGHRFWSRAASRALPSANTTRLTTVRPDGTAKEFTLVARVGFLESVETIPEPHAFSAHVELDADTYTVLFEEHAHGHSATGRDDNMRAAIIHVVADAAVSVHLWRLGPEHLGAIVSVRPKEPCNEDEPPSLHPRAGASLG
jgi:hypothetical protein